MWPFNKRKLAPVVKDEIANAIKVQVSAHKNANEKETRAAKNATRVLNTLLEHNNFTIKIYRTTRNSTGGSHS